MTKQELLTALEAKDEVLAIASTSEAQVQPDGANRYVVNLRVDAGNDSINYVNRAFYVIDEGGAGEIAYWEGSEPYPTSTPVETYRNKVEALIESKITDGTIKGATIIEISETNRTAYVRALLVTNNTEKFGYITDSNNDGTLEVTLI